jgi:hypothetical protein
MAVKFDKVDEGFSEFFALFLSNTHGLVLPPGESVTVNFASGFTVGPGEVFIISEGKAPNGLHIARTTFAEGRHESADVILTNTLSCDVEIMPEQLNALAYIEELK